MNFPLSGNETSDYVGSPSSISSHRISSRSKHSNLGHRTTHHIIFGHRMYAVADFSSSSDVYAYHGRNLHPETK